MRLSSRGFGYMDVLVRAKQDAQAETTGASLSGSSPDTAVKPRYDNENQVSLTRVERLL
jgi:hypothetical protein